MQYGSIISQPGVHGKGHMGTLCTLPSGRGEPTITLGIIAILIEGVECAGAHRQSQHLGGKSRILSLRSTWALRKDCLEMNNKLSWAGEKAQQKDLPPRLMPGHTNSGICVGEGENPLLQV